MDKGGIHYHWGLLVGFVLAVVVLLLLSVAVGVRVGFPRLASRIRDTVLITTGPKTARVLDLPGDVRAELTRLGAVISNAGDPTSGGVREHDTILVRPDARFGWVLRPGAEIEATVLRARNPLNLDPPVLYLPAGAEISPIVARYLRENSRLRYRFRIGPHGRRVTLPRVEAQRAILIVGDSVAFGVGVDDGATAASVLQELVGGDVRVMNTGVGGYTGLQVLEVARALWEEREFEALVYLSSQNDFMDDPSRVHLDVAEEIFAGLGRLRDRFSGRLVALFVSSLEFTARDFLLGEGWPPDEIRRTEDLYRALPGIAARHGFEYIDWLALVRDVTRESGSIFAPFALYVDHGHLSPRANRLAAEAIHDALQRAEPG